MGTHTERSEDTYGVQAARTPAIAGPRLAIRGVSKTWAQGGPKVLDDVDLVLGPGTLASLVGANGAGKTTLLRIVAGLISADGGSVAVEGLDPVADRRAYQQSIGFVPAGQTGLYARFSVRGHLAYWARIAFVRRSRRQEAIRRMIDSFELAEIAEQRVDRLSMGQRQRLRLAMGFLHEPCVVLLDEPRNSLDEQGRRALDKLLSGFLATGGTAVWCAPNRDEIDVPVAHALVLTNGRLMPQ